MGSLSDAGATGEQMRRVNKARPCPVCGNPGWCLVAPDGSAAICARTESHKRCGDAGWLHRLTEPVPPPPAKKPKPVTPTDWPATARKFAAGLTDAATRTLAEALGVPPDVLAAAEGLGYNPSDPLGACWTFPERDAGAGVVGILRRFVTPLRDGENRAKNKLAATGSRRGLHLPRGWRDRPGPVFVVEGPTDALALTAAGLSAVGRPSNAGGADHLAELLADWPADFAPVVVGENDQKPGGAWPGRDGAEVVSRALAGRLTRRVLVAFPPADAKDVRDWLTAPARGDTPWPTRGAELAARLAANAIGIDPPAPSATGNRFRVGDRVTPGDRGNVGTVVAVDNGTVTVQFVGKAGVAVKPFAPEQLKPCDTADDDGSPAGGRLTVPEYRPFPIDALPRTVREFVEAVSRWSDADPAFAALPALTVAGAAVGLAVCASPKRKYAEPPLLWACTVADSGTGKSPGLRPSGDIALAVDQRLKAEYLKAKAQYDADLEAWKAADQPDPGAKPARPQREYFYLIDTTIERLAENIGSSPRGVVVVRDELSGWFGSFTRYAGKVDGSDLPNWLSIFDAGPIRYHRRTGEPRDVEADRRFAAVCGGIQPGILRGVLENPAFLDYGLAARLVYAMPPKKCPGYTDDDLDPATEAALAAALDYLRGLPFDPKAGPADVGLDPAAKDRFRAPCQEFAATAEGIDGGRMSAALPKAARLALRLALIWHCVECAADRCDPRAEPIGDEAMRAGEVLARWFVGEAERVYAMLAEKPEDRSARLLAEWVRRKGGRVTPRDLQRSNRKYGSSEEAEDALDALVTAGLGRWDGPRATGGRPAGRVFVLDATPPADGRPKPTEGDGADGSAPDREADERPTPPLVNPETVGEIGGASACVGRRPDADGSEPVVDPAPVALTLLSSAASPSHPLTTGETTDVAPEPVTRSPSSRAWPRVGNDDRPHDLRG